MDKGNETEIQLIKFLEEDSPESFQPWNPPAFFNSNLAMMQLPESSMHLFHHGMTKSIVLDIQHWSTLNQIYRAIKNQMMPKMDQTMTLCLSWCKAQPHKGEKLRGKR